MRRFLQTLVGCSEKAASLARACRKESDLFQLLVEEKRDGNAHAPDFKTLADVLIQETVRHDLAQLYPDLADHILGEETNEFTNTLGDKIQVKVCPSQEETSSLLCKVLDGRKVAAELLAKEVHASYSELEVLDLIGKNFDKVPETMDNWDIKDSGIWIDPIDGTNQYIKGGAIAASSSGNQMEAKKGLAVVTVLIGVFNRKTGVPVMGVVNQPFVWFDDAKRWHGRVHWGCAVINDAGNDLVCCSSQDLKGEADCADRKLKAVVSFVEKSEIVKVLDDAGFEVVTASGAGYKLLTVILGWTDVYVTTTTYRWDTCAADAILISMGGGIIDMQSGKGLSYHLGKPGATSASDAWANSGGIIAFRNEEVGKKVSHLFRPRT